MAAGAATATTSAPAFGDPLGVMEASTVGAATTRAKEAISRMQALYQENIAQPAARAAAAAAAALAAPDDELFGLGQRQTRSGKGPLVPGLEAPTRKKGPKK